MIRLIHAPLCVIIEITILINNLNELYHIDDGRRLDGSRGTI